MNARLQTLISALRQRIDAWTPPVRRAARTVVRRGGVAASIVPASVVAVLMLAMAVSASVPREPAGRQAATPILGAVGADLSNAALTRMSEQMDPAAVALARRHDPALTPAIWGVTRGWENLSLTGRPPMDALGRAGLQAQRLNAANPVVSGALRPISAFRFNASTEGDRRRALRCLTQAVYYEAALEPRRGQEGVAQVVLNRVRDPNFPASVCGVVYQGAERVTGCQFSFTCDGSLSRQPVAWAWNRAEEVARAALNGHVADWVGTATHYHADYVRPWWAPTLTKVNQIGAHIFYRWQGGNGDTRAFRQAYSGREPVIDEARFARPRLTQIVQGAEAAEQAGLIEQGRTVVIDGRERQVGVISMGGRRQPSRDEIAAINQRMADYETSQSRPAVPQLDVIEVGAPPATPAPAQPSGG